MKKILVMGLPGAGKTTLAKMLTHYFYSLQLHVVHFNADEIRKNLNKDLGFSIEDRVENAKRLGWLAQQVKNSNIYCICDFVCPTVQTRQEFKPDVIIFVDTLIEGRFADTNKLFVKPSESECEMIRISSHLGYNDLQTLVSKLL